jgi:hypothetical protein
MLYRLSHLLVELARVPEALPNSPFRSPVVLASAQRQGRKRALKLGMYVSTYAQEAPD